MLTCAYITCRREPMVNWFFDSLHAQCHGDYSNIKIVVVDFYADHPGRREDFKAKAHCDITHIPPMPNVWTGPHRLTKDNMFAAATFRNTALCVSPDGYIVFVDDLSVLLPGWLKEVRDAEEQGFIACGAYQKVLGLEVDLAGNVQGYREFPPGKDTRCGQVFTDNPVPCGGSWCYGASLGVPVETALSVNGFDTRANIIGGEDYIFGIMLEKRGQPIRFCPRMGTFESEERHHLPGEHFKRIIKPGTTASGNFDSSHVILRKVQSGEWSRADAQPDLRALRQSVLFDNQPFPIPTEPTRDWFDGQPLGEL